MKMRVTVLESIFPFIISVRISNDTDFIFKSQIFFLSTLFLRWLLVLLPKLKSVFKYSLVYHDTIQKCTLTIFCFSLPRFISWCCRCWWSEASLPPLQCLSPSPWTHHRSRTPHLHPGPDWPPPLRRGWPQGHNLWNWIIWAGGQCDK